jgi:hypothetical protein
VALVLGETTMIRCDDVFVDSNINQLEKICRIIRLYEFDHLIGVTPFGEGKKLWNANYGFWKIHSLTRFGFLSNYRLEKMLGDKYIGSNAQLLRVLNAEFSKYEAIPTLHGLHHYRYDNLPNDKVSTELSLGIESFKKLFNVRVEVFAPPFNAWNHNTELVCRSLDLYIDKCRTGFDRLIENMNNSQIIELAKQQSSSFEVNYHPQRLVDLGRFELYLKTRRKFL